MCSSIRLVGLVLLALLPASARGAVDAEVVNRAIDRGVTLLKQKQESDGSWHYGKDQNRPWTGGGLRIITIGGNAGGGGDQNLRNTGADFGLTALVGLTLLHCGVPATDPAVVKAAEYIRARIGQFASAPAVGNIQQAKTYSFSLSILFLDRLGEAGDKALICKLTRWLVAYQIPGSGGWTYAEREMTPRCSDNSNTQFAILGLWTGQRYGVRVSRALAAAAQRFYVSVGVADGGWNYSTLWNRSGSNLSMTAAGVLVLAYYHAAVNKEVLDSHAGRRALAKLYHDRAIVSGLEYLKKRHQGARSSVTEYNPYYSLWSLERLVAALDLDHIRGVDLYDEAVQWLLPRQYKDGGWGGQNPGFGDVLSDTCFALLVLRRVDLSPDMTAYLKGQLPPREPVWSMPLKKTADHEPDLVSKDIHEALRKTAVSADNKADDAAIQALVKQLSQADGSQRDRLLHAWRDGEDERYTPALAKGIVTLRGPAQRKVRAALADRLTRLSVHEREEYLRSDDPEMRRAAVLSCAVRDDRQHLARLIELLQDREVPVAQAAHAVLCSLTGQDFGPEADASQADRDRAIAAWKEWAIKTGCSRRAGSCGSAEPGR